MEILYQDDAVIVCVKPQNLVSEQTPKKDGLADLLAEENGGYIGVVHRLDRGVGGVMVYAKTPQAAAALSREVQEHKLEKEYLAVVHGSIDPPKGTLRDLLFHDRIKNKSFVVERMRGGVKEAILDYQTEQQTEFETIGSVSLLRIRLHTGRTHQIRVQFSSRSMPLVGDGKYGAGDRCPIALFSTRLSFPHPISKQVMTFSALPDWDILEGIPKNG